MKTLYKNVLALALCLCAGLSAAAQSDNVSPGKVGFTPMFVKTYAFLPPAAVDLMEQKLMQVAMRNGVASYSGRYVLTAKVAEEDTQATATAPVQYVKKLSVQFVAYDMETKAVVGELTVSVTGVDKTPERATMAALRRIQPKTAKMTSFIQNASRAIVDAFNRNLENILKNAGFMAGQGKYDEALASLAAVPQSVDRYDDVLAAAEKICGAKAEADGTKTGTAEAEMKAAMEKEMTGEEQVTRLVEWEKWLDENK
ncbi:MAG: hypothetical protein J6T35_07865 [Bacteroidales bacterium]|nr:hypothetical protein [Bacteroidales bacterium]